MFDRLEDILIRYKEIEEELSNPNVVNDQKRYRDLMKEQSDLTILLINILSIRIQKDYGR